VLVGVAVGSGGGVGVAVVVGVAVGSGGGVGVAVVVGVGVGLGGGVGVPVAVGVGLGGGVGVPVAVGVGLGDGGLTVSDNVAVPVPPALVALSFTLDVPVPVGVPEIRPVPVLIVRPEGSPLAP
jgi:hypothetical protein